MPPWQAWTRCPRSGCQLSHRHGFGWKWYDAAGPQQCRQCGSSFSVKPITTNSPNNNNHTDNNTSNGHGNPQGRKGGRWNRNKQQQQQHHQQHPPASQNVASVTLTADEPSKVFNFLRKHYLPNANQSDESKAQWAKALEALHVLIPPKPQTPEEAAKSTYEHHETTKRALTHKTKVLNDMRNKYQKLCEELVNYQASIQQQEVAVKEAQELETAARTSVEELIRSSPSGSTPAVPPSGRSWQGLLTENLSTMLPNTLSTDEASNIRQHFIDFISTNSSLIAPPAAPLPPPAPPPAALATTNTHQQQQQHHSSPDDDHQMQLEMQHELQQGPLDSQAGTMSDSSIRPREEHPEDGSRDAKVRKAERSSATDPIGDSGIQAKAEAFAAAAMGQSTNRVSQGVQPSPP